MTVICVFVVSQSLLNILLFLKNASLTQRAEYAEQVGTAHNTRIFNTELKIAGLTSRLEAAQRKIVFLSGGE